MIRISRQGRKGFTLMEMMFGAFILGIGLIAILQGIIAAMRLNTRNTNITIAANDAQYVLELIKNLPYDKIRNDSVSGHDHLTDNPITGYTFPSFNRLSGESITYNNTGVATGLRQIRITVNWSERGQTKGFSLATNFSQ